MQPVAKGLPASPGAAYGKVIFDADEAEKEGERGEKVVLVRSETTPDDIHGIVYAQGVLTSRGNDFPRSCSSSGNGQTLCLWL